VWSERVIFPCEFKLIALGLFVAATNAFAIPASGITFGREVTNDSFAYPSSNFLWY
jgi:hypothetical protein